MKSVAILLTVYNRRKVTLMGLQSLYNSIENLKKSPQNVEYEFDIYMTDDGCTDGTSDAVKELYPNIIIIKTIGNLYWGRGMYLAWMEALKNKKTYEAYIWANDDNQYYEYALEHVIECAETKQYNAIICASFSNEEGVLTYGGADRNMKKLEPNGTLQPVYYMNGNFVLIPSEVVKRIGVIDPTFMHVKGDFDYGLSAIENGISVYTTTKYIGISPQNPIGKSRNRFWGKTYRERIKDSFESPFLDNPSLSFYFNIKHHKGVVISILILIKSLLVLLIPDFLYKSVEKLKK